MDLQQKVGGVPVYLIGGGIGVAFLGYSYFRSSRAAISSATPVAQDALGNDSGYPVLGAGQTQVAAAATVDTSIPYVSNTMWTTKVFTALVGQGKDPILVEQALEHYLNGAVLTAAEGAIVSAAIKAYGLPPEGVATTPIVTPAPVVTPTPVPGPVVHVPPKPIFPLPFPRPAPAPPAPLPTAPPGDRSYTVVPGDTLSGIAMRFYGHGTSFYYLKIAAANGIANANLIHPGQVLRIPA